jgi:hypothetical protein
VQQQAWQMQRRHRLWWALVLLAQLQTLLRCHHWQQKQQQPWGWQKYWLAPGLCQQQQTCHFRLLQQHELSELCCNQAKVQLAQQAD